MSLGRACWRTVRPIFYSALPLKLINDAAQFTAPIFLNLLLKVVADKDAPKLEGYQWAGESVPFFLAALFHDRIFE